MRNIKGFTKQNALDIFENVREMMKELENANIENFTLKEVKKYIYISEGNDKLISNDDVLFLIWNLPTVVTCPFRCKSCEKDCYAESPENFRPDALPCRYKNFYVTLFRSFFIRLVKRYITIKLKNLKPGRKIVFRFHESGDFYSLNYFSDCMEIVKAFSGDLRIIFMGYTKSLPIVEKYGVENLPYNFTFLSSIWADIRKDNIRITEQYDFRIYTACPESELQNYLDNGYQLCECKDCASCGKCTDRNIKKIVCVIHLPGGKKRK